MKRTCAEPGCITVLARDNKTRYCSACQRKHPPHRIGDFTGTKGQYKREGRPKIAKEPSLPTIEDVHCPGSLKPPLENGGHRCSVCREVRYVRRDGLVRLHIADEKVPAQLDGEPPGSRLTNEVENDGIVTHDDDLEKLAEATWIEATGDGERVRLDLRMGTNVILARCYISNAKAKDLSALIDRVSG